ncbi:hypothetical protein ASF27_12785 [Methylobacterium sp. Leaf102]|uniref:AAA family ATPase n=1 Tax=Methylobacterium sp. Leaf102 TaxID=1736253 RepID=UPI0006F52B6F|nr:AAA family ATPase [Methylobacterium sp. Leaf102]KQP24018.1 hypothetical protein ASF27_12785 [Methylobacterium sp. Leaf102]
MRILAIRGENLASLAAPFDIDLDQDPLGATGIFAITGETGAGKSTILDALCLALYGLFPRVSAARREDVPDPGGQTLNSGDPRAILRRGAGKGFAEVDFIGRDGVGYRARWAAYRARGRADGRLQNEGRSLSRIGDGTAVATGKTAVLAAVEAATDLTFEQFRRTVVLAQGEFDTFLLASEADRAELLEKITGTAVYSEISKRVHAGTDAQRAVRAGLFARHEAIGLLDAEARDAKLTERAAIEDGMPGLLADQAALAAGLAHARSLAAAEARLVTASAQVAEAAAAVQAGQVDAARVEELEAVAPLRRWADAAAASEDILAAAEELRERAKADIAAADIEVAKVRAGHAIALSANEAGENDLRTFTPVWSAADALDARITELATQADAAAVRARETTTVLATARTRREDLDRVYETTMASRDAAARRIAEDAAIEPLADRAAEIAGLFEKRTTFAAGSDAARTALADAETRIATADAATATARATVMSARETRALELAARTAHEQELHGLDVEAAEEMHAHLRALTERLSVALDLGRRHDRSEAEVLRARAVQAEAGSARDTAASRRTTAETARGEAARARTEIAALADLAERGASAEAAHLRSFLVPGQPCPVCGSGDHPVGEHGHGTDAMTRLVETMRGRRGELNDEFARADDDIAMAVSAGADATARFDAAWREEAQARASLSGDNDAYTELLQGLTSACELAVVPVGPPRALGPDALDRLAAISAATGTARSAIAGTLDRARALSGEIRIRETTIAAADVEIAAAEEFILAEADPRQVAALAAQHQRTLIAGLSERLESLVRVLGPFLAAGGLCEADLTRDADGTANRIAGLGAAYRDVRHHHRDLEIALNDVLPRRAVAIETEIIAQAAMEGAVLAARERSTALDDARQARAGLLGGEPTSIHRARVTAAREVARDNLRMAQEAVGIAVARHASAQGSAKHAEAQRQRAKDALIEARARFLTACGARAPDTVLTLLAIPSETLVALRDGRDRLLRAHEAAEAALVPRRADLEVLRAIPVVDVTETEAAAAHVAELIAADQRRRGALDADLAQDDAARGKVLNLAGEIEAVKESLAQWEMVDAAVGSANGDRFRRFAQGVTLEHLAQLANEQLRLLSPRYALVRSEAADLSLQILDRDMGDELRGTRSLSGGERFLVALALALALSGLEGRQNFVDTLFIDEGFGSLDADTLDVAVDALETLQGQGRRVGVITHVAAMIDRIAVQVRVERRGNGRSTVRVSDGSMPG